MNLEEFREYCKKNDKNVIKHEEMNQQKWAENFTIVCKKCGSQEIVFFGEAGTDYGDYTGYQPGYNGFKCTSCGSAISWWQ